jgi:hypothetical protein
MMKRLTLQFHSLDLKPGGPRVDWLRMVAARHTGATDRTKLLWRRDLLHPPCIA